MKLIVLDHYHYTIALELNLIIKKPILGELEILGETTLRTLHTITVVIPEQFQV